MNTNRSGAIATFGGELRELQQRALAEAVDDLDRGEVLAAKADQDRLEGAVLRLRRRLDPVEAVLRRHGREVEVDLERAAGQQRRRRRAERIRQLAGADLVQVGVVDPDLAAVGDDQLLERLRVGEAKAIRPRELEAAARRLLLGAVGRRDRLREGRAAGLHVADEVAQGVDRIGAGRHGARHQQRDRAEAQRRDHSARAGTRMSRLPLVDMLDTSPDFSICSSSRAARL